MSETRTSGQRTARTTVWLALLIAWMLCIFLFSAQPGGDSEASSDSIVSVLRHLGLGLPAETLSFIVRKAAHAFAYAVLGLLAFAALRPLAQHGSPGACWWRPAASLALVVLYAISDEVHQLFVPGRSGEARDVLIDATAGAVAIAIAAALSAKMARDPRAAAVTAGGDPSP